MASYLNHVTLITTMYNEADNILAFLNSYRQQTVYAKEFIMVDGGSTDGTVRTVQAFITDNPQLNIRLQIDASCSSKHTDGPIARGRNVAIELAHTSIIAVTDAGCTLDASWLQEIAAPFQDASVDVVSGWYDVQPTTTFQGIFKTLEMPTLASINPETFLPSSRSLAFKREAWEQVGGYPENSKTAEDTKFDLSLKDAGYRFSFAPTAVVYWDVPRTLQEAKDKYYHYGYGDGVSAVMTSLYLKKVLKAVFPYIMVRRDGTRKYLRYASAMNWASLSGYVHGRWHRLRNQGQN